MSETLEVGGLTFIVRRSARRKTLGLTVDRGGESVIHCPESATADALACWARPKLLWVQGKRALKEQLAPPMREPEYVSGENFRYLGCNYRLTLLARQDEALRFEGQRFLMRKDATANGMAHFRRWYIDHGRPWIVERADWLSPRIGLAPAGVRLGDLGFRWGSCGKDQVLWFNWKSLQLPVRLIDYVIVHELAHLAEPNHSPAFWSVLERAMPDWQDRQETLRTQAQGLYWCHPGMRS
ncbi:MAG: M48 family metallopeptidase [Candidatus Competibacteraceae bacterium]|nr:M48 family metallopeptidase [Candidatus Competibacteraceae bacterium]